MHVRSLSIFRLSGPVLHLHRRTLGTTLSDRNAWMPLKACQHKPHGKCGRRLRRKEPPRRHDSVLHLMDGTDGVTGIPARRTPSAQAVASPPLWWRLLHRIPLLQPRPAQQPRSRPLLPLLRRLPSNPTHARLARNLRKTKHQHPVRQWRPLMPIVPRLIRRIEMEMDSTTRMAMHPPCRIVH